MAKKAVESTGLLEPRLIMYINSLAHQAHIEGELYAARAIFSIVEAIAKKKGVNAADIETQLIKLYPQYAATFLLGRGKAKFGGSKVD